MISSKPPRALEDYWMIARRRRWWIILPLFAGWALVFGSSWMVAPQYRSETVIIVEPQRSAEQYVIPNLSADLQERLQSMTQQILSRTRLQKVIERFHLYANPATITDYEGLVQRMRRDTRIELVAGRPGELSAFKISYSAPSPLLAQQVTNELSSLFIEENVRSRQAMSENTTEFLGGQLQQARNELSSQEERLREFKSKYLGELPEQLPLNAQILSGLQMRLQEESAALDEANQQKLYLEKLAAGEARSGDEHASEAPTTLDGVTAQIHQLKAQLAEMSAHYKPSHPEMRHIQENLATAEKLREQMESQLKDQPRAGAPSAGEADASSPQLRQELAINSNKIGRHDREIQRLEKEIQQYQNRLNLAPVREQQLAEITRDYGQAKSTYESLLSKETQSEMATNLEKRQQSELFRVIDPANLPQKPYKPDRLKYSFLGLVMGLLWASGLTCLMETVDVRINRDQDFREISAVPILTAIPLLLGDKELQRQQRYGWMKTAVATAMVLAIPTITVLTYYRG